MAFERFVKPEELYLFNQGRFYHSYLRFGAHKVKLNNKNGVHFALWAPSAKKAKVVGNFNHWQGNGYEMERQAQTGVWTLFIPELQEGELYKYEIETETGEVFLKADPFAFYSEIRPQTASVIFSLNGYQWQDKDWMNWRERDSSRAKPVLIYEVHLGSWRRKPDQSFCSYREMAEELVSYVKKMGFTHLELLPLMEHPYDGSWGYQITGYYATTSRYGNPHDLMALIDKCHQEGIGVILDWVPGHFCKDKHGLARFDGTALFEQEEHQQWGTYKFDFSRSEVWSFLISNALFWLDLFHIDGLRVDGVTSMLLLNFGCSDGGKSNIYGGKENLEAVAFLRKLHEIVFTYHPNVMMIAEESTDWPLVTGSPLKGGLGFSDKWNMGWMNDTLKYMESSFAERRERHNLLTFSMVYAFAENFILPLSHDEVVHGKKSLIGRMPGDYWQKFAGLRVFYLYQLCHPGRKLLFMGGEFGQFIEWKVDSALEWFLLDYEMHRKHLKYVAFMNHLYRHEKSLWQNDRDWGGFEWIDVHNAEQSILIFLRKALEEKDLVVVILNFQPSAYDHYRVGIPYPGSYREICNTDRIEFGGSGLGNPDKVQAEVIPWHGKEYSFCIKIPPLGGVIFKFDVE